MAFMTTFSAADLGNEKLNHYAVLCKSGTFSWRKKIELLILVYHQQPSTDCSLTGFDDKMAPVDLHLKF